MNANRFDTVSRHFAERRLSRRGALQATAVAAAGAIGAASAGVVAGQEATPAAQDNPATPVASVDASVPSTTLFVQSFQSSTVTPDPAVTDGYRVTLSGGIGRTIAFSNRPNRDVMTMPQDQFLSVLQFPDDNPPNAALVADRGDGQTDLAVVELRNPVIDEVTGTLTYDLQGLDDWRSDSGGGLIEEAKDLSELSGSFGATHLFIDDCGDAGVRCTKTEQRQTNAGLAWMTQYFAWTAPMGYCYSWADVMCQPCVPYNGHGYFGTTYDYWTEQCYNAFPEYCAANGGYCSAGDDYNSGHTCDSPGGWCSAYTYPWR